jgi:hypothetical protein
LFDDNTTPWLPLVVLVVRMTACLEAEAAHWLL